MVWRWNDYVWGTSFTTTTPNEACGTLRTRKLQRDSTAPCWSEDSEPACRSTVCERGLQELAHCLNSAFFFFSFLNWLRSGKPLFRHRAPFLCLFVWGNWTFASKAFSWRDRPESALCLSDWTTVQREESYFSSPSLCFLFFFFFFLVQCFQTDWKAADFVCASVYVCVCVSESVGVCIYINVRGCVARSCALMVTGSTFFSNKETWRQPKIFFFFANTLPPMWEPLIECASTCCSDGSRGGGRQLQVEREIYKIYFNYYLLDIIHQYGPRWLTFSWCFETKTKKGFSIRNQPSFKQIHHLYISFCPSLSLLFLFYLHLIHPLLTCFHRNITYIYIKNTTAVL